MSLDGFVAAPNVDIARPMGDGGMCLHNWLFGDGKVSATKVDRDVADEMFASTGAFIIGRRTFDVGEGPWGDDGAFGMPCFVLTHREKQKLIKGATTFAFVTDGIDSALELAKAGAGDKNVIVMGGASIAQQYIKAGLVDEMRIHVAPVLLGAGTRLFDNIGSEQIRLERNRVIETQFATHLRFHVLK